MQFLGVGPLELLVIFILAIIVLGPKGMVDAARSLGKLLRKIRRSAFWTEVMRASHEISDLPRKIINETGIEKEINDISIHLNENSDYIALDGGQNSQPSDKEIPDKKSIE